MKIKDLFQLDIRRRIEGVIKAEQLDEPTVWQELSEYVVTDELEGHFRKFFDAYCNGLGGRGRSYGGSEIGVWVAGFFGSGKSHFIKVLSYLLKNETHTFENKSRTAISFFRDKFKDSILQADVKRAAEANTDVVLFNVASKADTSQKDALVRVFLRVLNELSGYSGVYPAIADMERYLDQNGLLVPFCAKFHEVAGKAWKDERDDWIFQLDQIGAAYSHVTDQKSPKFISVLESNSETYSISIEGFAKLVNQHINRKQLDRIVFLVDEVGQFIGDNGQRMLDLQTIAEELGTHCRGKAWIVITSQEDLDAVLGSVKSSRTNDFSKIQGRFRTRLSLSSANVDEVIQRRLLEKKAHIRTVLETRYDKRGDLINSLIDFEPGGMSMPKYTDATDFVRNYPILPFQFNLLQKTLDSIRKAGATGAHLSTGERSLLYAFQQAIATDDVAEGDVGLLVPFYRFYEPIAEDIETSVKAAIIQSATDPELEAFDSEVLKVLFLIRYVEEFDGTTRNLVTLCLDVLNANRQSMIQKVNGSLDRLKHRKLVSQTGDAWYFLTSEEKRIRAEISGTEISQYDLTKELWKLAFEEALGDLKKHRYESNNVDYSLVRNLNGREAKRSKVSGLVVWLISPQHAEYEHFLNPGIAILESQKHEGQVILRLKEDAGIEQDLMLYLRSEKYLKSRRRDGVAPETQRIFDQLRWKNSNHRRPSLIGKLGESIGEADCFVNGRQLETRGKNAKKTIASAVNDLIQSTYSKMDMLTHYDPDPLARARDYLRGKVVEQPDIENTAVNSRALTELCDHMRMSRKTSVQVVLSGLINRYYARPYGWPEEQTLLLLVRLATLSENNSQLQFIEHSTTLRNDQILDVLNNKGRWKNILVRLQEIDAELVNRAKETGQRLFERLGPDTPTELHTFLSKEIKLWQVELEKYHLQNSTGRYPGIEDVQRSLTSINKLLSNGDMVSFLEEFVAQSDSLVSVGDIVANQRHFFASQKPIWDRLCEALLEFGPSASQLEEDKLVRSHLQRLHDIRNAPEPYNKIKDIKGCIQVVKEANDRLLVDARNESISALTEIWDDLLAKLDDYNADPEDRSRFNNKIGKLERKIHEQTDILQIRDVQNQAQQLRSKTMDKISPVNIVPVFPRELGSQYLETEADVDAFLENLGKRLRSVISNGEHVEIR